MRVNGGGGFDLASDAPKSRSSLKPERRLKFSPRERSSEHEFAQTSKPSVVIQSHFTPVGAFLSCFSRKWF